MTIPKASICVKVVEQINKDNPEIIESAIKIIEKPKAGLDYLHLLPIVFYKFCKKRSIEPSYIIGVNIERNAIHERTLFIGVVLKIYSPGVFKSIYNIDDGVRHELEGMLKVQPHWISQQVGSIVLWYNRDHDNFRANIDEVVNEVITEKEEKLIKSLEQLSLIFA